MKTLKQNKKEFFTSALHILGIVLAFLLCSRFVKLQFVERIPAFHFIYLYASRIISLLILGAFAFSLKTPANRRKPTYILFYILSAVYVLLLFSTLINGGNLRRWLSAAYPILALCAFVIMQCATKDKMKHFLNVMSGAFWWLVAVNLLLMPLSAWLFGKTSLGGGVFLLGIENHLTYPLTIGLLFNLLNNHFNRTRARLQTYVIFFTVTSLLNFSVGSLAGIVLLLLYFVWPAVKRFYSRHRFATLLGIFAIFFIVVTFFAEPILSFPPFRFIIEDVLGKDVTLTHRTRLWRIAFDEILRLPIFGHGIGDSENHFSIHVWGTIQTWSAHNQYLQTLYVGGLAAMAAIVAFLLRGGRSLDRCPEKQAGNLTKLIITALMVTLLVEAPSFDTLFFAVLLGAAVAEACAQEKAAVNTLFKADEPLTEELISVVVPVYNIEAFLPECLDSIINQTYRRLEIILVNDGSTDGSLAICEQYAAKDDRIKLISQKNGGLSAARNTGIKAATAEYITFIDSDDAIDTEMIAYLYGIMKRGNADMSVCQKEFTDEQSNVIPHSTQYPDAILDGNQNCMDGFFRDIGLDTCAWGKLYKTSMFENVEYAVGKYHEDVFTTYLLVALCDRISIGHRRMYQYRQRSGSIIQSSFSPKHLHAIEATVQRAEFIEKGYPRSAMLARAGVVFSANSCAMRLTHCETIDPEHVAYLQEQYRRYEWSFLRGNSSISAKLFSLVAYVNLNATIRAVRAVRNIKRRKAS